MNFKKEYNWKQLHRCGVYLGVGSRTSRKINSLGHMRGGRERHNVPKYLTCSLGDGRHSKVSQKKSDPVRAKLKKTSLRKCRKRNYFNRPKKKPQGIKQLKWREQGMAAKVRIYAVKKFKLSFSPPTMVTCCSLDLSFKRKYENLVFNKHPDYFLSPPQFGAGF